MTNRQIHSRQKTIMNRRRNIIPKLQKARMGRARYRVDGSVRNVGDLNVSKCCWLSPRNNLHFIWVMLTHLESNINTFVFFSRAVCLGILLYTVLHDLERLSLA